MPLRRLAQLEQQKLKDEHDELQATIKELESILQSDAKLRTVIKEELAEVRDEFAERAPLARSRSTPASSTTSTSSRTRKSSSCSRTRAT